MIPGGSSPTRKLSLDEIYRPMTWNFVGIFPRHSRNTASQVGHLPGSRLLVMWDFRRCACRASYRESRFSGGIQINLSLQSEMAAERSHNAQVSCDHTKGKILI